MDNVSKALNRRYNSFINSEINRDFVIGLAEYVEYIQKTAQLHEFIKLLLKKKKKITDKIKKYEKLAVRELIEAKKELIAIIKKNNIALEKLVLEKSREPETSTARILHLGDTTRFIRYLGDKPLEILKNYEKNPVIISSQPMSDKLDYCLFEVAALLSQMGYHSLVEKFIDNNRIPQNIRGNFVFSKSLQLREEMNELLTEKREVELWGCWDVLKNLPLAVFANREELRQYHDKIYTDATLFEETLTAFPLNVVERMIWREDINTSLNQAEKANYQSCAKRIYNYLLENLDTATQTTKQTSSGKIGFDANESVLYFQNKDIQISNTRNTNQHDLLQTIFKNTTKIWNYDEIAEDWDQEYDKTNWKKFYKAGYTVNEKIAKKTTISDFLVLTKTTVKINERYVK